MSFPDPDDFDEKRDNKGRFVAKPPAKKPPKATKAADRAPTSISLEGRLLNTFEAIGGGISFINPSDGQIIIVQAAPLAKALDKLAQQNPNIKKILTALTRGGAWGEVLSIVFVGIVLPIAQNHGWQPPWFNSDDNEEEYYNSPVLDEEPIIGAHKPFGA